MKVDDLENRGRRNNLFIFGVKKADETRVRFPAAAATFLMQAKSKNARVFEISAHVKDTHVVKINPEPCTTGRLIVCVASVR